MKRWLASILLLLPFAAQAASPIAVVSPSRASGKAPLLVFFSAIGSTDTDTTKPIHHLTYCFNSGDGNTADYDKIANLSESDIWVKTTKKATFCGAPLWAYVYETPGTYTFQLTVIDEDGNTDTATKSITVSAYTAGETLCISTSGTTTGCPSGAGTSTSSDLYASVDTDCIGGGYKRCLFRAGETFAASATVGILKTQTGIHIGSYGDAGIGDGKFIITSSSNPAWRWKGDDGRLTDGSYPSGANNNFLALDKFITDTDNMLLQNWDIDNVATVLNHTHGTSKTDNVIATNIGLFDLDATNCSLGDICIFTEIKGMAVVNSLLGGGPTRTHLVRIAHGEELWIHGNKFINSASNRHLLTLRAFDWAGEPSGNVNRWAENVFVSDNWFAGNSGWPVQIGISGGVTFTKHRNYIFERNLVTRISGVQQCFMFGGKNATNTVRKNFSMRFNLCDGSNFTNTPAAMFNQAAADIASGMEFYNNSMYRAGGGADGIFMTNITGCTVAKNNVMWDANTSSVFNDGAACTSQTNNFNSTAKTGATKLDACPFSTCTITDTDDFAPAAVLISGGTGVPHRCDFNQEDMPEGTAEAGAFESGTTKAGCFAAAFGAAGETR